MSEPSVPTVAADQIDITLFREIILLPFTIDPVDPSDLGLADGRCRMVAAQRILESDPAWKRVENRACHLPEDRRAAGKDETTAARAKRLRSAYEEFVYFEPYVQQFLYGRPRDPGHDGKDPIALFARKDVHHLDVDFKWDEYKPEPSKEKTDVVRRYTFAVERCNLYLFETGNAMLAMEVRFQGVSPIGSLDGVPVSIRNDVGRMTLADCQTILENLRRVFPPYFTEAKGEVGNAAAALDPFYFARRFAWRNDGDGTGNASTEPVQAEEQIEQVFGRAGADSGTDVDMPRAAPMFVPWRWLLQPLVIEGGEHGSENHRVRLAQIGDDRAFVMAQIGVCNTFEIRDSDWVRLCYCDGPGPSFPYAKGFLRGFIRNNCYDRFFDASKKESWQTTRYLICNFAFVMVGTCFTEEERRDDWFRHVFSRHFRRHYFQLVMITLLHKVALLSLSERLAEALERPDFAGEAETVQRQVLNFTHRYWFEEISAQIQAHELFSMLRDQLRTRALYAQLSQEVREATARLAGARQDRLNQVAGIGLGAAVFVGIFGMNVFADKESLFGNISGWLFWPVLVLVAGLVWFLYRDWRSDWRWLQYNWRRRARPCLRRLCPWLD